MSAMKPWNVLYITIPCCHCSDASSTGIEETIDYRVEVAQDSAESSFMSSADLLSIPMSWHTSIRMMRTIVKLQFLAVVLGESSEDVFSRTTISMLHREPGFLFLCAFRRSLAELL